MAARRAARRWPLTLTLAALTGTAFALPGILSAPAPPGRDNSDARIKYVAPEKVLCEAPDGAEFWVVASVRPRSRYTSDACPDGDRVSR